MHFSRSAAAAALVAALPVAFAQTYTTCNPLNTTCPSDTGLSTADFSSDFTQGSSANTSWSAAVGTDITYGDNGAEFTISKSGQAPTIETDFYILFGRVEVNMQAAPGTGIISSIVMESDDLDEIDWEFIGGNTTSVETNFFGKGNTTTYNRAIYYDVSNPQSTFHTYTVDWTPESLSFEIDGNTVRTLQYDEALTLYGKNYPQTPMRVKLGNWAAGAEGEPEGTVEWAGGQTDFSKGPFNMYVKSVSITNYKPASSYTYGDETGDWQSIKLSNSTSSSGTTASGSNTASATGSSSTGSSNSSDSATTDLPTSSLAVGGISQASGVAVATTVVGSNNSNNSSATGTLSMSTSATASPTGTTTTHTGAASSNQVVFSGSLLGLALGFFYLL